MKAGSYYIYELTITTASSGIAKKINLTLERESDLTIDQKILLGDVVKQVVVKMSQASSSEDECTITLDKTQKMIVTNE